MVMLYTFSYLLQDGETVADLHRWMDFGRVITQTTAILVERLQAWKHMCGYLENYVTATHKAQKAQSKEFEKVFKVRSPSPNRNVAALLMSTYVDCCGPPQGGTPFSSGEWWDRQFV